MKNKPKHTPGPWVATKNIDGETIVAGTRNKKSCCIAYGLYDENNEPTLGEIAANAALIAAAPDLLEACNLARKEWGKVHDIVSDLIEGGVLTESMIPDDYQALVVALEAASLSADYKTEKAIKKAEGKS